MYYQNNYYPNNGGYPNGYPPNMYPNTYGYYNAPQYYGHYNMPVNYYTNQQPNISMGYDNGVSYNSPYSPFIDRNQVVQNIMNDPEPVVVNPDTYRPGTLGPLKVEKTDNKKQTLLNTPEEQKPSKSSWWSGKKKKTTEKCK